MQNGTASAMQNNKPLAFDMFLASLMDGVPRLPLPNQPSMPNEYSHKNTNASEQSHPSIPCPDKNSGSGKSMQHVTSATFSNSSDKDFSSESPSLNPDKKEDTVVTCQSEFLIHNCTLLNDPLYLCTE